MRYPWRQLLHAGGLLLAAACATREVSDTVNGAAQGGAVPLVEFARLPVGAGPLRFASWPALSLGGLHENDSLEFSTRTPYLPVAALVDGTIVVGDHQRLMFFDASGTLRGIHGSGGYGPGEFAAIRDLCPQSDTTLLVIDDDGRWSLWNREGRLLHAHARVGVVPYRGCSTTGDILVQDNTSATQEADGRSRAPYRLHGIDGTPRVALGSLITSEYFIGALFDPAFAFSGRTLLLADARTFELQELSIDDGRPLSAWRIDGVRTMTQDVYDSIVVSGIPRDASPAMRQKTIDRARELGNPGTFPAFAEVRRDPMGRIWINPPYDRQHWYVIDHDGMRLSLVTLPQPTSAAVKLQGFTDRYVIIRHADDQGAPLLSFYLLEEC